MPLSSSNSASRKRRFVDSAAVGEPPKKMWKHTESLKFTIYNFEHRKETGDEYVLSPILKAHGYKWQIRICPNTDDGTIVIALWLASGMSDKNNDDNNNSDNNDDSDDDVIPNPVTASFHFRVHNQEVWSGKRKRLCSADGYVKIGCEREHILHNYLEEDGSFVFEADIQISEDDRRVWYPPGARPSEVLVDLYRDGNSETADVSFIVDTQIFKAHKSILALRCRSLYEIAREACGGDDDESGGAPIRIDAVLPGHFKSLLDFVHTGKHPPAETMETTTDLLKAADRFQCVNLKLYLESVLVDVFLEASTAASLLILADSQTCALLKEAATNLFLADPAPVKAAADDWQRLRESGKLLEELLEASTSKDASFANAMDEDALDVGTLREELRGAGLELDGSREMLIKRLREHRKKED